VQWVVAPGDYLSHNLLARDDCLHTGTCFGNTVCTWYTAGATVSLNNNNLQIDL